MPPGRNAAPWATAEELAWADAHGINLSEWVRVEHAAGVRIAAILTGRARQRRLHAIDRAIKRRGDWLSALHQSGQRAAERTRREHRIVVMRTVDKRDWRPVCSCGWIGRSAPTRRIAERDADTERRRIFRPLSDGVQHTAGR